MPPTFDAIAKPGLSERHDLRLDRTRLPEPKTETNMKRTPKLTILLRIGIILFWW